MITKYYKAIVALVTCTLGAIVGAYSFYEYEVITEFIREMRGMTYEYYLYTDLYWYSDYINALSGVVVGVLLGLLLAIAIILILDTVFENNFSAAKPAKAVSYRKKSPAKKSGAYKSQPQKSDVQKSYAAIPAYKPVEKSVKKPVEKPAAPSPVPAETKKSGRAITGFHKAIISLGVCTVSTVIGAVVFYGMGLATELIRDIFGISYYSFIYSDLYRYSDDINLYTGALVGMIAGVIFSVVIIAVLKAVFDTGDETEKPKKEKAQRTHEPYQEEPAEINDIVVPADEEPAYAEENESVKSGHGVRTTVGNIFWLIFGGFAGAVISFLEAIVMCVTILYIPAGIQFFKLSRFFIWPMGKQVVKVKATDFKMVVNILWAIFFGWEHALIYLVMGIIFCITIIGIPFGKQYFKVARFALTPLGYDFIEQ